MDFGEILGKAGKIIWKNKVLWIFGILAGCGASGGSGGGGGNSGYRMNGSSSSNFNNPFGNMFPRAQEFGWQVQNFFDNLQGGTLALIIVGLVLFSLLISALVLVLSSIGKAGLIHGTVLADQSGELAEKLNFKQVWSGSKPYIWRIVLLTLLLAVAAIVLTLILVLPVVLVSVLTLGIGLLCILPLICIMIPVFWMVGVIIEQATVAIVVEDLGVFDSIKRAWQVVVQQNLGGYIVLALILGIGGAIVGFLIGLPLLLILVPVAIALFVSNQAVMTGGLIAGIVLFVIYIPIAILLSGILQAYLGSAWTLAFRQATRRPPEPVEFQGDLDLLSSDSPDVVG